MGRSIIHVFMYPFLIGMLFASLSSDHAEDEALHKAKDEVILQLSEDYVKALEEKPYVDLWERDKALGELKGPPALEKVVA